MPPLTFNSRTQMVKSLVGEGKKIVEVGVFLGEFANFLLSLKPAHLILIDPWEGRGQSGDQDGNNVKVAYLPAAYMNILNQTRTLPHVDVVRAKSGEVLPMFPDDAFDCIYLDGDHSYEGVKLDLDIAWKKVKKGGWLMGHDYDTNHAKTKTGYAFGVKQAVTEFLAAHPGLKIDALGMDGCVSFAIRKPEDPMDLVEIPDLNEWAKSLPTAE